MARRITYKDSVALRLRRPLPPHHKLRTTKRPGDRELYGDSEGVAVHLHAGKPDTPC